MVPNPFRHNLKVAGSGAYVLRLRTGGWIEGVQALGLGSGERYQVTGNGRKLELTVRPRPGRPREVAFSVRPMGAPVWLEGTRDRRPLAPVDVWMAEEGLHPPENPVRLPEVEPTGDDQERLTSNVFAPPREERPGIHLWLTMIPGRAIMERFDKETCERMKALGYVQTCP